MVVGDGAHDELRALFDLFKHAAQILRDDAEAEQLHRAQQQHRDQQRQVTARSVGNDEIQNEVDNNGQRREERDHQCHERDQFKRPVRKRKNAPLGPAHVFEQRVR